MGAVGLVARCNFSIGVVPIWFIIIDGDVDVDSRKQLFVFKVESQFCLQKQYAITLSNDVLIRTIHLVQHAFFVVTFHHLRFFLRWWFYKSASEEMSIMNIETIFDFLMLIGLITLAGLSAIYFYVRSEMKRQKDSLKIVSIRARNLELKKLHR